MRKWQIRHAAVWCYLGIADSPNQSHFRRWQRRQRSPRRLKLWHERTLRPQPDTLATSYYYKSGGRVRASARATLLESPEKGVTESCWASCAANRPDATSGWRGWWPNQWSGFIATALRSVGAASGHSACTRTVPCFSCSLCVSTRAGLPRGWLRPFASPERRDRGDHERSLCALDIGDLQESLSASAASIAALDGRRSSTDRQPAADGWGGSAPDESTQVCRAVTRRDRIGRDDGGVTSCVNFDDLRSAHGRGGSTRSRSASPRTRRAVDRLFVRANVQQRPELSPRPWPGADKASRPDRGRQTWQAT